MTENRSADTLAVRAVLALAGVAAIALLAPHLGYVPMWDGRAYAECAVEASIRQFSPFYLRCWGHASQCYLALLALSQLISPQSGAALIAVNAILLAIGAAGFHRLTRAVFPDPSQQLDRALLTTAFVLQPVFLASVLQPGLDLPVLVGIVWCTALLVERRWAWVAAVGTALVFSKETGVMLYALLLVCYAGWVVTRPAAPQLRERLRPLHNAWPAAVPLAAYADYVLYYVLFKPGQPAMWTAAIDTPLWQQFLVPRVDLYLASYLALIFVLNFAWIPSSWIVADLVVGAARRIRKLPSRVAAGADARVLLFMTTLAIISIYALTRFVVFSNARYLMPALALMLVLSYAALVRLSLGTRVRRFALVAYALLLVVSAERTWDPVSRALWGTFPVGSHEMLRVTSITGECCGIGRDQLVYSLEFARLHEVMDDALAAVATDTTQLLVIPANTSWYTVGPLDARSRRRTLHRTGTFEPPAVEHGEIMKARVRPNRFYFLALPNANIPRALVNLGLYYEWPAPRRFARDGYELLVYDMTLRQHTETP